MKRFRLITAIAMALFMTIQAQAQVDVKINPIGLLFSSLNAAVEFGVQDNVGVEVQAGFSWPSYDFGEDDEFRGSIVRVGANGRYYFNPSKGLDRFYAGIYTRYAGGKFTTDNSTEEITSTRVAAGFLFGTKIVARNERLLFDFGIGAGRAFVAKYESNESNEEVDLNDIPLLNWDVPLYIAIGYRF